jgi:hypothetical protein
MAADSGAATQAAVATATVAQSTSGLGWSDIVALVGAAAWLPQIWRFLQKPKVTPIVGGQVEIGFTHLGPVFNPKVAFRAQRRDALVTGIQYRLQHERGQTSNFRCAQLVEYGAQTASTSGETAFHERHQDVVALVLTPTSIIERKTNSREVGCLDRLEALGIALVRAIDRTRRPGNDWIDEVLRTPEYQEIRRFLEDSFIWQAGTYQVECAVSVADQSQPSTCRFQFVLGEASVELLRRNLTIIVDRFRRALLAEAPAPAAPAAEGPAPAGPAPAGPAAARAVATEKLPNFNWIYAYVLVP